ncbi:trichohyalin, putative [Entamoeba histolytica]
MQHQQNETISHIFDGFDNEGLRISSHDVETSVSNFLNKYIGNFIKQQDNFYQQLNQFQNKMNDIEMSVIMLYSKDEIVGKMKDRINMLETMTIESIIEEEEKAKQVNEKLKKQSNEIEANTINIVIHRLMIEDILKNTQTLSHEYKELIRELIEEEMMTECLTQYEKQISFLNKSRDIVLNERNTTSMSDKKRKRQEEKRRKEEERKKQEQEKRLRITKGISTMEEIEQLEEWTNRKVGNILFDSDIDNWNYGTSVFDQRIWKKEHIIIIIEDEEGNKFGGYVNSKIDKIYGNYIYDSKSFVFSLNSNGRMKGMMKFDIKKSQHAFCLYNQTVNDILFEFGFLGDICVFKENIKTLSSCHQFSFEYNGMSNALCGKYNFTPKRIIVIEMK